MHLLGASVVGFILLPLAFSCEISNHREQISQDYQSIIVKQLQHINEVIKTQLNFKNCSRRTPYIENPKKSIHNVSCNRIPKGFYTKLENELKILVENINESLGCQCPTQQGEKSGKVKGQGVKRTQKKLCRLKHSLAIIQEAYEQYNSGS